MSETEEEIIETAAEKELKKFEAWMENQSNIGVSSYQIKDRNIQFWKPADIIKYRNYLIQEVAKESTGTKTKSSTRFIQPRFIG